MKLYHFTSKHHLEKIRREGVLRTTESNVDILKPHAGPDVVWFIDTPTTEGHGHGLTGAFYDKTEVRITIDVPPYRVKKWTRFSQEMGMDPLSIGVLVDTGGGMEAADHWWVSERPIPRKWWTEITDMTVDA